MIFTSLNFLLFFPLLAILFYVTPIKWRSCLLLVASILFYLNINPVYLLLLLGVCVSTYVSTTAIDRTPKENTKRLYMRLNILLILIPLFFYKYFGAINNSILSLMTEKGLHWPLPEMSFLLPVGISFYTFVAIGYTIDVYNEDVEAEKDFGIVALFISFFPLILSGPIERASNMIPQFKKHHPINYAGINAGLKMMLWGYFMKLVVADRLSGYIDVVLNNVPNHNGTTLFLASALYPFQIYADLGGYSLVAIGTARVLGIDVMQNFKRPFFATSMGEFWRRWHISLITWLTDYIYTPLAFYFRRYKMTGVVIALFLTFLISGIWHGAALTFVFWGALQGFYLSVEALTQKRKTAFENKFKLAKKGWYIALSILLTFVLFSASQIFARSADLDTAFTVFNKIATQHGNLYVDMTTLAFGVLALGIVLLKDFNEEFLSNRYGLLASRYFLVRSMAYVLLMFTIILLGVYNGSSFIYFQF